MKTHLLFLCLYVSQSAFVTAADTSDLRDISPAPMISASRALRVYVADAQTSARRELESELALVSLTEELILVRWRKVHRKDLKSRDAVLAEVDHLTKRIDELLARVSKVKAKVDHERLSELKAAIDVAVDDFRLRLKTAFFQ